ncbi:hypothetical protein MTR66_05045 [Novosphingobium sp. 2638]|uniref:Uncharacterized protein n=1 Tax=Novosphingobium beihaiensis TaxID=2930389 RepID=A0ABT0BMY0_9SPHN|nr:hypothetical protein [Novosphingobium beihaiensis]MCJ2186181.1 hypothetical protein [Novosphingobium beihaiensis]
MRPLRLTTVEMIRVWAAMTGLFLVALYFGVLSTGSQPSPTIAMLVSAIAGFEIFFFGQDQWLKRRGKHG